MKEHLCADRLCHVKDIVIVVRQLQRNEVEYVDGHLPLNRLDESSGGHSTYLIAWEDERPVGHVHLAWQKTHLEIPEIQDVYVVPARRRHGIATLLTRAAEDEVRSHGWSSISLSVSQDGNPVARSLYERLGYVDAGVEPRRVAGTIILRGRRVNVDDTLVYLRKRLERP
jgi:GNAT superfamily N-acetyltransferase